MSGETTSRLETLRSASAKRVRNTLGRQPFEAPPESAKLGA